MEKSSRGAKMISGAPVSGASWGTQCEDGAHLLKLAGYAAAFAGGAVSQDSKIRAAHFGPGLFASVCYGVEAERIRTRTQCERSFGTKPSLDSLNSGRGG